VTKNANDCTSNEGLRSRLATFRLRQSKCFLPLNPLILKTKRLTLSPTKVQDAAFYLALMNSEGWLEHIGDRGIHSVQAAEEYIRTNHLPQLNRLGFSSFTVRRKENNEMVGSVSLFDRDFVDDIEIGFAFLPHHHGKGYALEASERLMRAAEEELGFPSVGAITVKENLASQRLLEKLGLRHEKNVILDDSTEEVMVYRRVF